jgi:hypothetical protein
MGAIALVSALALLLMIITLSGCKFAKDSSSDFDGSIQCIDSIRVLPINEARLTKVPLPKPVEELKSSTIESKVEYVFLETTQESLIGSYDEIVVYKDRIYILDDLVAQNVFIFDLSGKFICKMPTGAGPDEFGLIRGMFVDKIHDRLIVYDCDKREFVYCSLDGKRLAKKVNVQLYFFGRYAVTDSDEIVYLTERSLSNPHVEALANYRLLYTDSLGRITKAAFPFDDNKDIPAALSNFKYGNGEILFYPKYTTDIYRITNDSLILKYRVDLSNFNPIPINEIRSIRSIQEFSEYEKRGTFMTARFSETDRYLYFSVLDNDERICAFYNKATCRTVSFRNLIFDANLVVDFPRIYSDGSRFFGVVSPSSLKQMAESRRRDGHPLNKELEEKIADLKEDDNSPLVLFTIK